VLDRDGIRPLREHRTPERILAWIDAEFGGARSSEAASGGIWIAEDEQGPIGYAAYDVHGIDYHWLRSWATHQAVGVLGSCGVVPRARGKRVGTTLLHAAMFSLRERGFRKALIGAVHDPELVRFYERALDARVAGDVDRGRGGRRWRATVLASGNGSNFQGVLDGVAAGHLPLDIGGLIVNRAGAFARERAVAAGVLASVVVWDRSRELRDAYDARVLDAVASTEPQLVLLLGWMHVLPATFITRFTETLNLHPAFLPLDPTRDTVTMPDGTAIPAFRGGHALDDALAVNSGWAGASVHRVGVAVDRGEVLARAPIALIPGEARTALDERLHALERSVVTIALRRWAWEQP